MKIVENLRSLLNASKFFDISFVSVSRIAIIIGQMIYVKIYTNHLIVEDIGVNAFLSTVSYFLNALIFVPIDCFQQSKIFPFKEKGVSLTTLLILNGQMFKILLIPIVLILAVFFSIKSVWGVYALVCVIMSIVLYIANALRGLLNNLGYYRAVSIMNVSEISLKIVVFLISLSFFKTSAFMLFSTAIIALLILCVILWTYVIKTGILHESNVIELPQTKDILKFIYPLSAGAVLNWLQVQGYRLLLVPFGAADIVGIYSTVSNIGANAMSAPSLIFNQLNIPKLYKTKGKYIGIFLIKATLLITAILIVSLMFSEFMVRILTNETFVKYSGVIAFGIIAEAGNFLIGPIGLYLGLKNRNELGLIGSITGMLSMVTIFWMIHAMGKVSVWTIGLPIVLSQLLSIVVLVLIYRRIEYARINYR